MSDNKIQRFSQELDESLVKRGKNKKRNKIKSVFATIAVLIVAAGSFIAGKFSKNFKPHHEKDSYSISSTDSTSLSDLGKELESKPNSKDKKDKYNGYIKGSNGKLYADSESAKNAYKVGNSIVDTQGGKLTVDSNGKVTEKDKGYEIKDSEGNIIDSGNENSDGKVPGFEKNEELGGTYEEGDITSNDVRADANYYDQDGNLIISKGELIEKDSLDWAKQNLSTTKPTKQEEETQKATTSSTSTSTTTNSNQSGTNADGTYTDAYGNIWISYQDYISGALDFDNVYTLGDGILRYDANLNENTNQKVK